MTYRSVNRRSDGVRSLTQVSQQIRAEFYPLYIRTTFIIKAYLVPKFVKDILPRSINLRETITLEIDLRKRYGDKPVDIWPALASTVQRDNFRLRFQCDTYNHALADVLTLACHQRSRWQAMIRKVGRILIFEDPYIIFREKGFEEFRAGTAIASQEFWAYLGFTIRFERHNKLGLLRIQQP